MANLAAALKSEVRKLSVREIERALKPLREIKKQVRALRLVARAYKRTLASLRGRIGNLRAASARVARSGGGAGGRSPRMSPKQVRTLRGRFGLSRHDFGRLVGASHGSIYLWEAGRVAPRGESVRRVAAVRRLSVEQARARVGLGPAKGRARRARGGRRPKRK